MTHPALNSASYNYVMAPWQWSLPKWIAQIENQGTKLYFRFDSMIFWIFIIWFLTFCLGTFALGEGGWVGSGLSLIVNRFVKIYIINLQHSYEIKTRLRNIQAGKTTCINQS